MGRLGKIQYLTDGGFFNNQVAIHSNWLTAEDVYVVADDIRPNGTVYLHAWVKPLINLIWAGGIVFVFGSLLAMWPDAREQRRLVERYSRQPVTASTSP